MRTILVGAALVALATSASAQDKRPDYGTAIEAAAAKKIAAGALAECQKNGWNVAVAVVDTHGFLVYFERMTNTQTASVDIAIGKARAAATYRRTTRVFMDAINKGGPATATLPGASCAKERGVSIREAVLIGACGAQPRSDQNDVVWAKSVISMPTTHLVADT